MIQKIFKNKNTKFVISIIWGFGIACIFRKVCNDRTCIEYKAPNPNYILNNIWRYNNKCYKFNTEIVDCNKNPIT